MTFILQTPLCRTSIIPETPSVAGSFTSHLLDPPPDIPRCLLHRIQLCVSCHRPIIIPMLLNQLLQPLPLPLTLISRRLGCRVMRLLNQTPHHVCCVLLLGLPLRNATPFLPRAVLLRIRVKIVQRVIQRIWPRRSQNSNNLAVRVPLHFCLGDNGLANGCYCERVVFRYPRRSGAQFLLHAAGGSFEPRDEPEAAIVLGERFLLVPDGAG